MENKLRLAFVTCDFDPWISPIFHDVLEASNDLQIEMFVIGSYPENPLGSGIFIDLLYKTSKMIVYDPSGPAIEENIDLTKLVHLQMEFLKRTAKDPQIEENKIKDMMVQWLNEALILLKLIEPDAIVVWNGLMLRRGVFVQAGKYLRLPVFFAEKGMLPDSWYIDRQGINAESSIAEENFAPQSGKKNIEQVVKKILYINKDGNSTWDQPPREPLKELKRKLDIQMGQKVIFFPGQVDSDSNIILFSPHFNNTLSALKWLVEQLSSNEFFILAKPHPKGALKIDDFNSTLGVHGKAVADVNILDAIELADCVVAINSTVLFEAAVRKKPVLQLGVGVLSKKPFITNYNPTKNAKEQIEECIERFDKNKDLMNEQALRFAAYLNAEYYAYRREVNSAKRQLEKTFLEIVPKNKNFTFKELKLIFQKIPDSEITKFIPTKKLIRVLFEKIKYILRCFLIKIKMKLSI